MILYGGSAYSKMAHKWMYHLESWPVGPPKEFDSQFNSRITHLSLDWGCFWVRELSLLKKGRGSTPIALPDVWKSTRPIDLQKPGATVGKMGQSVQRIWGPFPFNVPFGMWSVLLGFEEIQQGHGFALGCMPQLGEVFKGNVLLKLSFNFTLTSKKGAAFYWVSTSRNALIASNLSSV